MTVLFSFPACEASSETASTLKIKSFALKGRICKTYYQGEEKDNFEVFPVQQMTNQQYFSFFPRNYDISTKPIFFENKKNIYKMSSAEIFTSMLSVYYLHFPSRSSL